MIKKLIPSEIKIQIKLFIRWMKDLKQGISSQYAQQAENIFYTHSIKLSQALNPNDNKRINLEIAGQSIRKIEIKPGEIFSFWRIVGRPKRKYGFVESRSIVNGKLVPSLGGGLCQLSGLIYYISLLAGLEIIERHNHSVDIYTDETRFTPLGSDATVAFGSKDLRIRNTLNKSIHFTVEISEFSIQLNLNSSGVIEKQNVRFESRQSINDKLEVYTWVNDAIQHVSYYKKQIQSTENNDT